jgi:FtsZ-binding cell division protein ZapB
MPNQLFQKLDDKVTDILEFIEFMRSELRDAEEQNVILQNEIASLRKRQQQWENSLATLLDKLDSADLKLEGASQNDPFEEVLEESLDES